MKKDVMQAIADTGILPVINITDITTALPLAKAILDGGLKALEVTLRSEVSLQAISKIVKNYPDLHILAGTVLTVEQAQAALDGQPIPERPPLAERCDTAVRQIELATQYNCEKIAVLTARRHYAWYLKGVSHATYYKEQIVRMETLEDVYRVTAGIKRDLHD